MIKTVELTAYGDPHSGRSVLLWHISYHLRSLGLQTHVDGHTLRVEATGQQLSHLKVLTPQRARLAVVRTPHQVERPCDSEPSLTDGVPG